MDDENFLNVPNSIEKIHVLKHIKKFIPISTFNTSALINLTISYFPFLYKLSRSLIFFSFDGRKVTFFVQPGQNVNATEVARKISKFLFHIFQLVQ